MGWHCGDEPLFGGTSDQKLIVSLSLGSAATFEWKAKSCSDSEASSYSIHNGDLLVMDGRCQDEYLHCTSPGLAERRVNITYRWIRYHTLGCTLAAGVLGSLPTCAQGSPVLWGNSCIGSCLFWVPGGFDMRVAFCAFKPSFPQSKPQGVHALFPGVRSRGGGGGGGGLEYVFPLSGVMGMHGLVRYLWPFG